MSEPVNIKVVTAEEQRLQAELSKRMAEFAAWIVDPNRQGISLQFPVRIQQGDFDVIIKVVL